MKNAFYSLAITLSLTFSLSSFLFKSVKLPEFTIKIEGGEKLDMKKGISPTELSMLTIESNSKKVKVEKFDITLARGKRPVGFSNRTVTGNSCDLTTFANTAKSGDRLVLNITETSGVDDVRLEGSDIIVIPIR